MTPPKTTRVQLEEDKKNQFIEAVSGGQSVHSAAKKYGIRKSTAQDIWTKWKEKGSLKTFLALAVQRRQQSIWNVL